jgi:muconolactone D-isomerase
MLFHVEMTVNLPPDMDAERAARLKADEKAM